MIETVQRVSKLPTYPAYPGAAHTDTGTHRHRVAHWRRRRVGFTRDGRVIVGDRLIG
jgi:hypothetical protein